MIYGKLSELKKYLGLHPNLDTAIRYAAENSSSLSAMKPGRTEIDGDAVFAACADYMTEPQENLTFEEHIVYADIHIMRQGTEYIGVAAASELHEFERSEEKDYIGYQGNPSCIARVDPESFVIALPGEPHMVHIMDGNPDSVKKIVIKVKMS